MEVKHADLPLVSIVITSFNRADMIGKAIASALAQDYPNFEVIITDNCSEDGTEEEVAKYLYDKRVKFSQNEVNIGMVPNFKKGIEELSNGKYFVNLCSDDQLVDKSFITNAVNLTRRYPDVTIVRGRNQSVQMDTGKITLDDGAPFKTEFVKGKDFFLDFTGNENFGWEGVMLDREVLNTFNVFEKAYSGFDKSANLALLLRGNICLIDKVCYSFTVHSSSHTYNPTAKSLIDNFQMVEFPYEKALQLGTLDSAALKAWRRGYIFNISVKGARALYIRNKAEYQSFVDTVEREYGIKAEELRTGLKVRIDYLLYRFPVVGKSIAGVLKILIRAFSWLRGKKTS